jgi:hypothetical protein
VKSAGIEAVATAIALDSSSKLREREELAQGIWLRPRKGRAAPASDLLPLLEA